MEPIINYLEDAEKKLVKEMAELFSKMREQRDTMSLTGIEDMYNIEPIEGILYDPCVRIPMTLGANHKPAPPGHYYWTDFALPKDEYVIYKREAHKPRDGYNQHRDTFRCIALTSHGRYFFTKIVRAADEYGSIKYYDIYSPDANRPVIKLEPLPYKIPTSILKALKLGMGVSDIPENYIHYYDGNGTDIPAAIKTISDTSASLQELNKEFYLFSGKWKPHMTEHATLDVDTMRQTIIENTNIIQELTEKNKALEDQNKSLQTELKELKEHNATLEKEKATLLNAENINDTYYDALLDFMDKHSKQWHEDDTVFTDEYEEDHNKSQITLIKYFNNWHSGKVFMDKWEYHEVMNSKDELNEYRIYKKIKSEMVSNGMDNSDVARNVRTIKRDVKKLNNE